MGGDDAGEEELPVDEDADVGDAIEDDIEACEDDEALFVEAPADEPEVSEERAAQREILKSNVDRVAWKTELERVGPRLRLAQRRAAGKEWRAHVDLTRASAGVIRSTFPPTRAQLDDLGRAAADAYPPVAPPAAALAAAQCRLDEARARVVALLLMAVDEVAQHAHNDGAIVDGGEVFVS